MLQKLIDYMKEYLSQGCCVAFSGGADSALLLKAACMARQQSEKVSLPVLAAIVETRLHPHEETEAAVLLAEQFGAVPLVIHVDEFSDPEIRNNPRNRCYLCKHLLFDTIKKTALEKGYHQLFDGTNFSDTREYRPGLAALAELGVHSPLKELGLEKGEIRELSGRLGLQTADKPSAPCMATRLPYGAQLDYELLNRLNEGEQYLRKCGFYNVRLRYHDPLLRIEVDTEAFSELLDQKKAVIEKMKALGFVYVTLDLEGFRSGSMDI